MCCNIDKDYTKAELTRLENEALSIKGYKVIHRSDTSGKHTNYTFKPGLHKMSNETKLTMDTYNRNRPRGFHFFLTRKDAEKERGGKSQYALKAYAIVEAEIPVNDIIGLSLPDDSYRQGVANSLFISKAAWKKAGLKVAGSKS